MKPKPSSARPTWLRIVIWVVVAFVLVNLVSLVVVFVPGIGADAGFLLRLALVIAVVALPLWQWHGKNVLGTWGNPATASFTRRDDPATGGVVFDVQPARAARMPALPLFAAGAFFLLTALLVGSRSTGAFIWAYLLAVVFIGVGCSFVLPGARDRKAARISVSAHGVQSGDIGIPLASVGDLSVEHGGLVVLTDPIMPGRNGVPISSMAGRQMGRRQEARGFAVTIRAEGENASGILAGGLTEDCAGALAADIAQAVKAARGPSAAPEEAVGAG